MKNANKAKAKVQAKNQKGKDVKEDNQTSVLPNQELEKPVRMSKEDSGAIKNTLPASLKTGRGWLELRPNH